MGTCLTAPSASAAWKTPQMLWAEMQDRRMFNEILFSSYEGISNDRLMILADDARRMGPAGNEGRAHCSLQVDTHIVSGFAQFAPHAADVAEGRRV